MQRFVLRPPPVKLMIGCCTQNRAQRCILPLYVFNFLGNPNIFPSLPTFLLPPLLPSFFLSVSPPQGKGYSVLLFEVDICIIRLGCVIVSGLPHQRVLQRREGAVQPNNGRLSPPLPRTLQPGPAPASHPPPTHGRVQVSCGGSPRLDSQRRRGEKD